MPPLGGALDEESHDVVRIVGIAHGVRRTQQHLQQQIRHSLAQRRTRRCHGSSLRKRIATSKVAPPQHSIGEKLRHQARVVRRNGDHVVRAHARRKQGLMRIAHRRVGEQNALLDQHPLREALGPELVELLLGARAAAARSATWRQPRRHELRPGAASSTLGVAVDDGLADVS